MYIHMDINYNVNTYLYTNNCTCQTYMMTIYNTCICICICIHCQHTFKRTHIQMDIKYLGLCVVFAAFGAALN